MADDDNLLLDDLQPFLDGVPVIELVLDEPMPRNADRVLSITEAAVAIAASLSCLEVLLIANEFLPECFATEFW